MVSGAFCLGVSRAKAVKSTWRSFALISLGALLMAIGVGNIYIAKVADEGSWWMWFAAALACVLLVRFGASSPRQMAWRFVVYGFLAPLVGSLLDGLINQEEYAGLMLVLAVLPLWALLAIQLPQSVPQKIVRAVVCVAAPVFAICFYVVSRSLVNYGDGVRATFLQVPFLDLLRLPSWYDQFGVDVYLKAALLTSFFLVGLLSAAYFLTQRLHSQQPV